MKIALVADVFGEHNNGTSITAERLVAYMRQRGHDVVVVSPFAGDGDGYVALKKRKLPLVGGYIEKKNGVTLAAADEKVLRDAIASSDVVHFLVPFRASKVGLRLARENGVAYTAAFHCQPENITSHIGMMNAAAINRRLYRYFWHNFYKDVHFIHCPSAFIARQLQENGYTADLRVISNGVIPTFRPCPSEKPPELRDKFCILFTGRFSREKRHDLLIEAVRQSAYADRIQLIFAGNGPRRDALEQMGRSLPHPPLFRLFSEKELCRVINFCDLYVHPSDVEIEAISCIEAFTCGLVPLISDSPRSATGQFALTPKNRFAHGDPAALARGIDYWLEHPEEKARLSGEYIVYAQQFAIDRCIDQMEAMFRDAVAYYAERKPVCR